MRHAGVRLGGQRQSGRGPQALDRVEHCHRPHAAVAADHIRSPFLQAGSESLRRRAVQAIAFLIHRDLGDERNLGAYVADGQHGLVKFLDVAESLEDDQVHACFRQRLDLFAEGGPGFLKRGLAERLNANPERAHRARDPHVKALGCLPGELCPRQVDGADFVRHAVAGQPDRVGPESVGFDDLCPGLQVLVMELPDQRGLGQVQLVVAAIDEYSLGVQQGARGAVAQDRGGFQAGDQIRWHVL